MQITKDLVAHIAKLARIKLSETEVDKFTGQMTEIVKFVEKLNEVDTKNVPETSQVNGMENVLREDEVKPFKKMKEVVECSNNPTEKGQIKVKKSI